MKKAVIQTGGKQYVVAEGETIRVELIKEDAKADGSRDIQKTGANVSFVPLMVIDGSTVQIGTPSLDKVAVTAEIINNDQQADKVTSIRYKAKKRVHTVRGHRQHQAVIKITKIA